MIGATGANCPWKLAWLTGMLSTLMLACTAMSAEQSRLGSLSQVVVTAEQKTVKLYGAGGTAGLDSYQSGFFVSQQGHILTTWSTVLDVDEVIAVTSDGSRIVAKVLGIDPTLEIAVLESDHERESYFDLTQAKPPQAGRRILALSNLFGIATGDEMSSVQRGIIMAVTQLNARRGAFESVYQGPVAVIDATTNNPGAAGGALIDLDGAIVGMLGKELRDANASMWLNYAIPITELRESVQSIIEGRIIDQTATNRAASDRPTSLAKLGIVLVPNVLKKTPAFVDLVIPESPADRAGLRRDDLILFVEGARMAGQSDLVAELKYVDEADPVRLMIQRGTAIEELTLAPK